MNLKIFLKNSNERIKDLSREEYKLYLNKAIMRYSYFPVRDILNAIEKYFDEFEFAYSITEDEFELLEIYFKLNSRYKKSDMRKVAYYLFDNSGINSVYKVFNTFETYAVIEVVVKQARNIGKLQETIYYLYLQDVPITVLSSFFESIAGAENVIITNLIQRANMDEFLYISNKNYFIEFEIAKLIELGYSYTKIQKRYTCRVKKKYDIAKKLIQTFSSYYEKLKKVNYLVEFNNEAPICYIRSSRITKKIIF